MPTIQKPIPFTIKQRGYKINEQSGKRVSINKIKKLNFDSYSLQF
jgi:hypothetical protein